MDQLTVFFCFSPDLQSAEVQCSSVNVMCELYIYYTVHVSAKGTISRIAFVHFEITICYS